MTSWDVVIVDGGIAGSVVTNQLLQKRPELNILLIEAGRNVNGDEAILESTNVISNPQESGYMSAPQANLNVHPIFTSAGKALGGRSAINGSRYAIQPQAVGSWV
jgi:choline dehydrogenase